MNDTIIRTTEEISEAKLVELCREHLPDISKRTGVPLDTLKGLSGEYQMRIFTNANSEAFSIAAVNRIVGEGIYDRIIADCAEFMGIPKRQLYTLNEETQEQVIGSFDMQRELVPDDKLKEELFDLMNGKAGK